MKHTATREERFWVKVEKTKTCWLWLGSLSRAGYGIFYEGKQQKRAHRVSWELAGRELIDGLTLDHVCRVRNCVNPDHLEQVTIGENTLRGLSISALNARKTRCPQGHQYDEENTYHGPNGARYCRACTRAHQAAYRKRKAAQQG